MKIAIIAAEITPWAKVGGLADVINALPVALKDAGAEPSIILPGYRSILGQLKTRPIGSKMAVPLGGKPESFTILGGETPAGIPIYIVNHPGFFDRDGVYGERGAPYDDNFRRYIFFGRAAVLAAAELIRPGVIHAHDWHTAMAPIAARADPDFRERLKNVSTIFTVHNLAFQGILEAADFPLLDIDDAFFSIDCLEFYGKVNLMKGAIVLSDGASTVSPSYAREVTRDSELGFGLEGVLRGKGDRFQGILNGADYAEWDPVHDMEIPARYDGTDATGKKQCARALRREFSLAESNHRPLAGMVTRLTPQKGTDLLIEAMDKMMALDLQMIILGSGDPASEEFFRRAAERYPDRFRVQIGFDNALAHRIQAGSDIFLMPSRFEPCGLTQMYALRYGAAPLVRATGGLRDTIAEYNPETGEGNGFVFEEYSADAMLAAIRRALAVFHQPVNWKRLMQNGFAADFSWDRAAREYLAWFGRLRQ